MSIRKMRKKMKPVIFVITIGFFISMLTVIVSNISMGLKNKQYAFKVNNEKVAIQELERGIDGANRQYGQYFQTPLERNDAKLLATDNIINDVIIKQIGKDLKVKVSGKEIDEKITTIKSQIPAKDQFKRMLKAQGFTEKTFEKSIESSILIEKTREKIVENIKITDQEKKTQYEKGQFSEYLNKTYEEAQETIEKQLKEQKGNEELARLVETGKKKVVVEDIRETYGDILPKVVFEENGFSITEIDVLHTSLYQAYYGVKDIKEAKAKAITAIKEDIRLAKISLDKGAKKDESLPVMAQIMKLKSQLVEEMRKDIVVKDSDLKEFFDKNKKNYDTDATVDTKLIKFAIKSTNTDEKIAKEKAEKILKELTPQNFAEMAKKYSEGPSASNGGELGWFEKGQMIPEFEKAAFEGKAGEICSKVVKTQFGFHIIFVEDKKDEAGKVEVKASHILIKVTPSEETHAKVMETALAIANDLKTDKLTFDSAVKKPYSMFKTSDYNSVKNDGYFNGLGYETELVKEIYASNLNEIKAIQTEKGIYVFEKTSEVKSKKADFNEQKERVIFDYKNKKLAENFKKL